MQEEMKKTTARIVASNKNKILGNNFNGGVERLGH